MQKLKKILFILMVLLAGLGGGVLITKAITILTLKQRAGEFSTYHIDGKIVLYGTSWCPACKAARAYLTASGVTFTDQDIEKSTEANRQYQDLGATGVPTIIIGNTQIDGFNPTEIDAALVKLVNKNP